eukprot:6192586-Pyramimonas_sp.AAC.1
MGINIPRFCFLWGSSHRVPCASPPPSRSSLYLIALSDDKGASLMDGHRHFRFLMLSTLLGLHCRCGPRFWRRCGQPPPPRTVAY